MLKDDIPGPQHDPKDNHGLKDFVTGVAGTKETKVEEVYYEKEVELE